MFSFSVNAWSATARHRTAARQLMQRAADGDKASFMCLYDRFGSGVYAMALTVLGDAALARQATCTAFVEVWRTAPTCPIRDDAVRPWVVGIAAQVVDDHLAGLPYQASGTETDTAVHERLRLLPLAHRQAMLLAAYGGLSVGQSSQVLAVSPRAVARLLHEGLLRLTDRRLAPADSV
ncbi:RNA polymerase sigma factor [Longispora urticae]